MKHGGLLNGFMRNMGLTFGRPPNLMKSCITVSKQPPITSVTLSLPTLPCPPFPIDCECIFMYCDCNVAYLSILGLYSVSSILWVGPSLCPLGQWLGFSI